MSLLLDLALLCEQTLARPLHVAISEDDKTVVGRFRYSLNKCSTALDGWNNEEHCNSHFLLVLPSGPSAVGSPTDREVLEAVARQLSPTRRSTTHTGCSRNAIAAHCCAPCFVVSHRQGAENSCLQRASIPTPSITHTCTGTPALAQMCKANFYVLYLSNAPVRHRSQSSVGWCVVVAR